MKDTKIVHVDLNLEIENTDAALEAVKRITHHAEELLDLDSWPEIKAVYGVTVEVRED